jgi:phenylpropionate dioxygenase-like ring-hydroxylating dioxygenase large terminal subunit
MYPFDNGRDYVRNGWYAAGWSGEFGETLLTRTFLDEAVILYRTSAGEPVALADRCAHRAFPLSLGTRIGDTVRCGYHGFTYDGQGRCVAIPSQDYVPPAYGVRHYPLLERGGVVWIWMGEPNAADAAQLPDLHELGLTDPNFLVDVGGVNIWRNRYQLINENLLDLSHIEFLHLGTIGTKNVAAAPVVTTVHPAMIEATRTIYNDQATPLHTRSLGIEGAMDRTTRSLFFAPGAHVTHVLMVAPGSNARFGDPGYFGEFKQAHLITPSTAGETYYFWSIARTANKDAATSAFMLDAFRTVFAQDGVALEAQERSLQRDSDFHELSCKADEAALKARRLLRDMMSAEKTRPRSPHTASAPSAASSRRTS